MYSTIRVPVLSLYTVHMYYFHYPQALERFPTPVTRQVLLAILENERYYYQVRLRAAQMVAKLGTLMGPNWTGALPVLSLNSTISKLAPPLTVLHTRKVSICRAAAAVGSVPQALPLLVASGDVGREAQLLVRAGRHCAPGVPRAEDAAAHSMQRTRAASALLRS